MENLVLVYSFWVIMVFNLFNDHSLQIKVGEVFVRLRDMLACLVKNCFLIYGRLLYLSRFQKSLGISRVAGTGTKICIGHAKNV